MTDRKENPPFDNGGFLKPLDPRPAVGPTGHVDGPAVQQWEQVWRAPAAETNDYPGLWVRDGRVTGSITIGRSRLPAWTICGPLAEGWGLVEECFPTVKDYGVDGSAFCTFLYHLLEQRGEFARLLCVLADVDRDEADRDEEAEMWSEPWWRHEPSRRRVLESLANCTAALEGLDDQEAT